MCLDRIHHHAEPPITGYGYKVFDLRYGILTTEYCGRREKEIPVGVWIHERDYRWTTDKRRKYIYTSLFSRSRKNRYPFGFHVFRDKDDAMRWCEPFQVVRRVKFMDPVAVGLQSHKRIVVVKLIRVGPRDIRRK